MRELPNAALKGIKGAPLRGARRTRLRALRWGRSPGTGAQPPEMQAQID